MGHKGNPYDLFQVRGRPRNGPDLSRPLPTSLREESRVIRLEAHAKFLKCRTQKLNAKDINFYKNKEKIVNQSAAQLFLKPSMGKRNDRKCTAGFTV